jgi:hypothetical protein
MTVSLIPQDELTLNLLAEVLAEMYQLSLNTRNDASDVAAARGTRASSANIEDQRQDHFAEEPDLVQDQGVMTVL